MGRRIRSMDSSMASIRDDVSSNDASIEIGRPKLRISSFKTGTTVSELFMGVGDG